LAGDYNQDQQPNLGQAHGWGQVQKKNRTLHRKAGAIEPPNEGMKFGEVTAKEGGFPLNFGTRTGTSGRGKKEDESELGRGLSGAAV